MININQFLSHQLESLGTHQLVFRMHDQQASHSCSLCLMAQ